MVKTYNLWDFLGIRVSPAPGTIYDFLVDKRHYRGVRRIDVINSAIRTFPVLDIFVFLVNTSVGTIAVGDRFPYVFPEPTDLGVNNITFWGNGIANIETDCWIVITYDEIVGKRK